MPIPIVIFRIVVPVLLVSFGLAAEALGSTSWTGTASTAWSNGSNWTGGVPSSTVDAIIGDASFTGLTSPRLTLPHHASP